jgi:HK97 family phage major capsid protein
MSRTNKETAALVKKAKGLFAKHGKAETMGDALAWFKDLGADVITDGSEKFAIKEIDISGLKMVQITLGVDEASGAAEVLAVEPMDAAVEGEAVGDEDEDKPEDEKGFTAMRKAMLVDGTEKIAKTKTVARDANPAIKSLIAAEKRYTKAAQNGGLVSATGCGLARPIFSEGETATKFGAWVRLRAAEDLKSLRGGYSQMASDLDILGKTSTTTVNLTAGATVPDEYIAELIENRNQFGAARQAIGVSAQSQNFAQYPKLTGELTVNIQETEGSANTDSDMNFGNVGVTLHTFIATSTFSRQLMDDSAISMSEAFGRSWNRAQAEKEDRAVFLGTAASGAGVNDLITGTNGADTYDANATTSTTTWATSWTIDALQAAQGQLPEWARSQAVWVVSAGFFDSRMQTLALNAGGNDGSNIAAGFRDLPRFSGLPVIFSSILPTAYSANQIVGYVGAFPLTSVFAEKASASEVGFDESQKYSSYAVVGRGTTRAWFTHHDIGSATAATSGVVALKD